MSIILHPHHPDYTYLRYQKGGLAKNQREVQEEEEESTTASSSSTSESGGDKSLPFPRADLRSYMLTHSVKGTKPMPIRTPFIGEVTTFPSPLDSSILFGIRRLSNGQVMAHRDRNSVVRFITESSDDEEKERFVQERDYPAGTMTVDIAVLGLTTWNIQDEKGHDLPINQENILRYLDPEELDFISEKVLEVNPIISSNRNQKKRTRDSASATDGSSTGGDDTPPVRKLLSQPPTGSTI